MNCKKCGAENLENSEFCTQCGKPFRNYIARIPKSIKIIFLIVLIAVIVYMIIISNSANEFNEPYLKYKGIVDNMSAYSVIFNASLENILLAWEGEYITVILNGKDITNNLSSSTLGDYFVGNKSDFRVKFEYDFFSRKINKIIVNEL